MEVQKEAFSGLMEYYKLIEKECLFCGASLSGRRDKKYCDDNCRNNHHYNLNKDTNVLINKVNRILSHNRQLLKSLCRNAKIVVKKQKMKDLPRLQMLTQKRQWKTIYVLTVHQTTL